MTDVMVHSLLDGSFSFVGSKFSHIQESSEADMSTVENNVLEKNYNEQMDITYDKSSESTVCESDTDDSIVTNEHVSDVNVSECAENSSDSVVQKESNISNEDYKVLTTKTTVINTTYNLVAQSTREIVNMTAGAAHSSWSSFPDVITEAVDKSRVIVQVLKSDLKPKAQSASETTSSNAENQSAHSFRDDLCKLLSKSVSLKFDEGKSSQGIPMKDTLNVSGAFHDVSLDSQDARMHSVRARRKRNLKLYFCNGRGIKISDLKCVCDNLRQANPASLRYLHYVMFNSFGLCGTALQLLETKKNITGFCGYPFKRSSEQFQKKLICLKKIPEQMLIGIHRAIFGKTQFSGRSMMVDQLVDFLWMPRKCSKILKRYESKKKFISEEEYAALKESALRGPVPSVMLQKLSENYIRRYTSDYVHERYRMMALQSTDEDENSKLESEPSHTIPAFILNGPGTKLKHFPEVAYNVQTVPEKPIKMLHYILYGRVESCLKDCRRNVLEFNGFSDCQQEFAAERKDIIIKLSKKELLELCQILCLRAKTSSKEMRIRKILEYLQSPSKTVIHKGVYERKKVSSVFRSKSHMRVPNPTILTSPSVSSDCSDEIFGDDGWKLRDFRTICSNVECAAPSDLIELNDLLFLKNCDESDIHQKILDFTRFKFTINSFHYDSRKTLMHYMGVCVVRKIARLLDIENWDKISNPEDLFTNVLKFLMEKKGPESPHSRSSTSKSILENNCVETPKSFTSEFFKQTNEAISHHHKGKVIIQRLTKASVQTQETYHTNEIHDDKSAKMDMVESIEPDLPHVNSAEDDSILLRDLIHHPSEEELKVLIFSFVKENLWCFTLGDLVQKVFEYYPKVNLLYRENFIKITARQILSELRDYAVNTVNTTKDHTF